MDTFVVLDAEWSNGLVLRCILFVAKEAIYLVEFCSGVLLKVWTMKKSFSEQIEDGHFTQKGEGLQVGVTLLDGTKCSGDLLVPTSVFESLRYNLDWCACNDYYVTWQRETHIIRCPSSNQVVQYFGDLFGYPAYLFKYDKKNEVMVKKNVSFGAILTIHYYFVKDLFLLKKFN